MVKVMWFLTGIGVGLCTSQNFVYSDYWMYHFFRPIVFSYPTGFKDRWETVNEFYDKRDYT